MFSTSWWTDKVALYGSTTVSETCNAQHVRWSCCQRQEIYSCRLQIPKGLFHGEKVGEARQDGQEGRVEIGHSPLAKAQRSKCSWFGPDTLHGSWKWATCPCQIQSHLPRSESIESPEDSHMTRPLVWSHPRQNPPARHLKGFNTVAYKTCMMWAVVYSNLLCSDPWPNCFQPRTDQRPETKIKMSWISILYTKRLVNTHKVVWSENLAIRSRPNRVHGARFQIDQNSSRHIFPSRGLIVVDLNPLDLQLWITLVQASGVHAMLIRDDFPELCQGKTKTRVD